MKAKSRKVLSLVIAFMLVFSAMPFNMLAVYADEGDNDVIESEVENASEAVEEVSLTDGSQSDEVASQETATQDTVAEEAAPQEDASEEVAKQEATPQEDVAPEEETPSAETPQVVENITSRTETIAKEPKMEGTESGVAKISDTTFGTLAEALSQAASGDIIQLLDNVTESITVPVDVDVTIDLNGFTITNAAGKHTITNNGTLTITDSDTNKAGTVNNVSHGKGALVNNAGAKASLDGGKFTRSLEAGSSETNNGGNSWYTLFNQGEMTINEDATVENNGQFSSAIINGYPSGATATTAEAKLTVNGGTLSGGINTIKNDERGVLEVNGGTIENEGGAGIMNWHKAEINDVEINAQKVFAVGRYGTTGDGVLTVKGGTFAGDTLLSEAKSTDEGVSVALEGGKFDVGQFEVPTTATATITGAKFKNDNVDPNAIPEGKKLVQDAEGYYYLVDDVSAPTLDQTDIEIYINDKAVIEVNNAIEGAYHYWKYEPSTVVSSGGFDAVTGQGRPVGYAAGTGTATLTIYTDRNKTELAYPNSLVCNVTVKDVVARVDRTEYAKADLDKAVAAAMNESDKVLEIYPSNQRIQFEPGDVLKVKAADNQGKGSITAVAPATTATTMYKVSASKDSTTGITTYTCVENGSPNLEITKANGDVSYATSIGTPAAGSTVKVLRDCTLTRATITNQNVTIDLNGHIVTVNSGSNFAAIIVGTTTRKGSLTIKDTSDSGDGKLVNTSGYAVWAAYNSSAVTIEGGEFVGNPGAVYTSNGSTATITGGTFKSGISDTNFVLNCQDGNKGTISVSGGTFHGFDPADNTADGEGTNYVVEGYSSISKGDPTDRIFEVVKKMPAPTDLRWDPVYPTSALFTWDHEDLEDNLAGFHANIIWEKDGQEARGTGGPVYGYGSKIGKAYSEFFDEHGEGAYSFYTYAVPLSDSGLVSSDTVTSDPVNFYALNFNIKVLDAEGQETDVDAGNVHYVVEQEGEEYTVDLYDGDIKYTPEGFAYNLKAEGTIGYEFQGFSYEGIAPEWTTEGSEASFTMGGTVTVTAVYKESTERTPVTLEFGENHSALAASVAQAINESDETPYNEYSGLDAEVNGSVLTIQFPKASATKRDAYDYLGYVVGDYLSDREYKDKGERIDTMYNVAGKTLSEYVDQQELIDEMNAAADAAIGDELALYVLWQKPITDAGFEVKSLVAGTNVAVEEGQGVFDSASQNPVPEVSATKRSQAEPYEAEASFMPTSLWLTSGETEAVRDAFGGNTDNWVQGTVTANGAYYAAFAVVPKMGYYFDEENMPSIYVNQGNATYINMGIGLLVTAKIAPAITIDIELGAEHEGAAVNLADYMTSDWDYPATANGSIVTAEVPVYNHHSWDGETRPEHAWDVAHTQYMLNACVEDFFDDLGGKDQDKVYGFLGKKEQSDYTSWNDVEDEQFATGTPTLAELTDPLTFYALWGTPISEVALTVDAPAVGVEVVGEEVSPLEYEQNPQPYVTVGTEHVIIHRTDEDKERAYCFAKNAQGMYIDIMNGTVEAGETYRVGVDVGCDFPYLIDPEVSATVNGDDVTKQGYLYRLTGNWLEVSAEITAEEYVARIGNRFFKTLDNAKNNVKADGSDTIVMIADTTEGIYAHSHFTLDLNGHTISAPAGAERTIWLPMEGIVTIKDSSEAGTGKVVNTNANGTAVTNYNKLTIEGGTFEGNRFGIDNYDPYDDERSYTTINGGTFIGGAASVNNRHSARQLKINGGLYSDGAGNASNITRANGQMIVKITSGENQGMYKLGVAEAQNTTTKDYFEKLDEAKNFLDGTNNVVKVLKDINLGSDYLDMINAYTLDLNGYKIASDGDNEAKSTIHLSGAECNMTITDTSESKTGAIVNSNSSNGQRAIVVEKGDATLTIDGGTIRAEDDAIESGGKLIMNGGTVDGVNGYAFVPYTDKPITINGGVVTGGDGTFFDTSGKVTLNGGYFVDDMGNDDEHFTRKEDTRLLLVGGDGEYKDYYELKTVVAKRTVDGEDIFYTDLQEAVNEAEPRETVTLITSLNEEKGTALTARIDVEKDLTIDLGGKTIAVTHTSGNGSAFNIKSGTVEIKNGTIDGKGVEEVEGKTTASTVGVDDGICLVTVRNGATLNLNDDNLTMIVDSKNGSCVYSFAGGKANIAGGTYKNITTEDYQYKEGFRGMTINQANVADQLVNITGGTFYGQDPRDGDDKGLCTNFVDPEFASVFIGRTTFPDGQTMFTVVPTKPVIIELGAEHAEIADVVIASMDDEGYIATADGSKLTVRYPVIEYDLSDWENPHVRDATVADAQSAMRLPILSALQDTDVKHAGKAFGGIGQKQDGYGSWDEVIAELRDDEGTSPKLVDLTEAPTLYALWAEPITQVDLTVEPLVDGTKVTGEGIEGDSDSYKQDPQPIISVLTEHLYIDFDEDSESKEKLAYWFTNDEGDKGDILNDTVQAGQTYIADFTVVPEFGYLFDYRSPDLTVMVNGESIEEDNYLVIFTSPMDVWVPIPAKEAVAKRTVEYFDPENPEADTVVKEFYYPSLHEAIDAAVFDETILDETVTLLEDTTDCITFDGGARWVTLDLNGKIWTVDQSEGIKAVVSGELIIENGTIQAADGVENLISASDDGYINLGKNLTVNAATSALYSYDNGMIIVNGATVNGGSKYATAVVDGYASAIHVEGGVVNGPSADYPTVSVKNQGSFFLHGTGVVSATHSSALRVEGEISHADIYGDGILKTSAEDPAYCAGFALNKGTINITSGEVISEHGGGLAATKDGIIEVGEVEMDETITGDGVITVPDGKYALIAHGGGDAKVTIYSGTVNGAVAAGSESGAGTVTVEGGVVNGEVYNNTNDATNFQINGGVFKTDNGNSENFTRKDDQWLYKIASGEHVGMYELNSLVASIERDGNTNYYPSLDAAHADVADGETITVLATIDLGETAFRSNKTYTLDLNGFEIKGVGGEIATGTQTVVAVDGGKLTVKDSSDEGTGKIYNSCYDQKWRPAVVVGKDRSAEFVLESGTVISDNGEGISNYWQGTATIEGGQVLSGSWIAIDNIGGTVTVRGDAYLQGIPYAIDTSAGWPGTISIEGGKIVSVSGGQSAAIMIRSGDATISGGEIEGPGGVSIKDGTVIFSEDSTATVKGKRYASIMKDGGTVNIYGGKFSDDTGNGDSFNRSPNKYLADPDDDKWYELTDVDKSALEAALTAAKNAEEGVATSEDGKDLADGTRYTTAAEKQALDDAIAAAQKVFDDPKVFPEQVAAATEAVDAAKAAYEEAIQTAKVDKTALNDAIAAAKTAEEGVATSEDGKDLKPGTSYTTPAEKNALDDAIAAAKKVADDPKATQNEVDAATEAVNKAKVAYEAAKKTVGEADKTALNSAIKAAQNAEKGIATSKDGSDVDSSKKWTTAKEKKALDDAIAAAKKVADDKNATQKQVDDATAAVKAAQAKYDKAKKAGTKVNKIWYRLSGTTRYDTMKAIVDEGFTKTGGTVIVATGDNFKDALSASGIAGLHKAPVVTTNGQSLSSQADQVLKRLKPSRVIVIGGSLAVSDKVLNQIKNATGVQPKRVYGQDSCDTSAKAAVALNGKWKDNTAIIATNKSFKDALSVAPISYAKGYPILLANGGTSLTQPVLDALKTIGTKQVIIVGGEGAVSKNVVSQLNGIGIKVKIRLAGANGAETSSEIAKWGLKNGMTANKMGVATSQGYADALAGAALCGINKSVLVLADDAAMTNASFPKPYKAQIKKGYVFGGEYAVGPKTWKALNASTK